MIRCIIVEDETLAQDVLRSYLQKTDTIELVAVCDNAQKAAEILDTRDVDLSFSIFNYQE